MSGGYFDYKQYAVTELGDEMASVIKQKAQPQEVRQAATEAQALLYKASILVNRIDWYMSGDDGLETFVRRLEHDLDQLEKIKQKGEEDESLEDRPEDEER